MSLNKSFFIMALGLSLFVAAAMSFAVPAFAANNVCGSVSTAKLISEDDGSEVGQITIWNSTKRLVTRFEPSEDWSIAEISYQPARWLSYIPKGTNGALDYAGFSYQRVYTNPVVTTTFQTPQKWEIGDDLHLAARLVLVKLDTNGKETDRMVAWGDGKTYSNTAQYFKHIVQICGK
jgi:hypothetical protein